MASSGPNCPESRISRWCWLVVALAGCNALFGLDEGRLAPGEDAGMGGAAAASGGGQSGLGGESSGAGGGDAGSMAGAGGAAGDTAGGQSGAAGSGPDSPTYREVVLSDGPAGYWRLGESGGSVAVDEIGANHGLYLGDVTFGVAGALDGDQNSAVKFENGSVSIGDVFDFPDRAPFSLEVWALPSNALTSQGEHYLIDKYGVQGGYHLYVVGNYLALDIGAAANDNFETLDVSFGASSEYRHIVATFDGQIARLYLNGVQVATRTYTAFAGDTPESLRLGDSELFANSSYPGSLDEVAIYDYALPPARVLAHYAAGRP